MSTPTRPLAYVRLSDLRADDLDLGGRSPNLDDQTRRIRAWCRSRSWPDPEVLVENDLTREGKPKPASAFKRRKIKLPNGRHEYRVIRPVFRAIVDRLATDANDGLVALDLDRAVRDPRDLEDLVDLVEHENAIVESVTGSLRLATDADVTAARIMVAVANKESRDKARRVSARREVQAHGGIYGGGRRPYGFLADGVTVDQDESKIIAGWFYVILRRGTLRGISRDLNDKGVPTVTGRPWTAETVRDIMLRPRNAGLMVHRGKVIGQAPWNPIVPVDVYEAAVRKLTDPMRDTRAGTAPRWLGSGLYVCGVCGATMQVTIGGRAPRYLCKASPHLARSQVGVDAYVVGTVLEWIRRDVPEAYSQPGPAVDVKRLRGERARIEASLSSVGGDVVLGLLTRAAGIDATRRGKARIAEIDAELAKVHGPDPAVSKLARAADPWTVWEGLSLERQRMVVQTVARVTIHRAARRGRGFDPGTVVIEPA